MKLKQYGTTLSLTLALFLSNCGNGREQDNIKDAPATYHQDFSDNVALIAIERNGVLWTSSSGFVTDKEKGLVTSAKHAVSVEGKNSGKIFLNGKVYDGTLIQTPAAIDAGKFQITSRFDPRDLPEPYKIGPAVKKGDKVFVKGLHPHSPELQEEKMLVPILSDYYKTPWEPREYVLDILEATVVEPSMVGTYNMAPKKGNGNENDMAAVYLQLKTKEDHRFSFGGLSGGPVVNERNELVGIVAQEIQAYYELTYKGLAYHPWDTIFVVPIEQLEESGFISR